MRIRFIYVVSAALVLLIVALGWPLCFGECEKKGSVSLSLTSHTPIPPSIGVVSEALWLGDRASDITQRVMSRSSANVPYFHSTQEVEQARNQLSIFTATNDEQRIQQSPLATPNRLTDGRLWMNYDMNTLGARVEGDRFELSLPGIPAGITAQIDTVDIVNGQYRWEGRLSGASGPGSFSITQVLADQYAVGSLNTANGEFLLEAKSGIGWVASSDKESRHDENDAVEPPPQTSTR